MRLTTVIMTRFARADDCVTADTEDAKATPGPSIWVLHSTGLGANRQLTTLASAIGGHPIVKDTLDRPWRAFCDRLLGSRSKIPTAKRAYLHAPWPDLVLFGGGRSWLDAVRIRAASGGVSRIVCVGRPGAPLDSVDLTLTTPQYGLPDHPRVLHLDLPLNFHDQARLDAASPDWSARFEMLPRPWIGVMLGGDSGSYRLNAEAARALGRSLATRCRHLGGAALVTTSPRTRDDVLNAVLIELGDVPNFHYRFVAGDRDNPLDGILALADAFVVTADSASMLAEACFTGRHVAVFEPPLRWRARLLARSWLPSSVPGLQRAWSEWRMRQTAYGRWVPARRMERIHRNLAERGVIARVEDLDPSATSAQAGRDDLARAVTAIRALLPPSDQQTDGYTARVG